MEEEKLPVWEFAADEKGLSIKVQNIYCNDMYGPEDSFGASVNYNNFVSQFFDECWSFEDVLNTFIYELKQEIEHSIPFDYMPIYNKIFHRYLLIRQHNFHSFEDFFMQ